MSADGPVSPELAKKFLETNLINITEKLKAGGTLTRGEQVQFEKIAAKSSAPKTQPPVTAPATLDSAPPPPSADPAGPVGPAEIARHWSAHGYPCTRQYASKCVQKLGCPKDSLAAALAWRQQRGAPTAPPTAASAPSPGPTTAPAAAAPVEILGNSLDALLARARQTERDLYTAYLTVRDGKDIGALSVAMKAHRDAQRNLIEVEGLVFDEKEKRGEFVSLPVAQQRIDDRLATLRAARQQLSRKLALALFPEAPAKAQQRIELEICRVLDPAIKTAETRLMDTSAQPPDAKDAAA